MPITTVFFDIGDVLFDENAQHQFYFHSLLLAMRRNGVPVEWDDYHAEIQRRVRTRPETAIIDAARTFVPEGGRWDHIFKEGRAEYEAMRKQRPYGMLLDDMEGVCRDLAGDFQLGIIANQHPPVVEAIRDYGLLPLFGVMAVSEVVGLKKPDPRIFRWALERAGCQPEEAVMIGDRPDNDIAPANGVGMRTIRFRRGILYSLYDPLTPEEHADVVVRDIARLARAVRRLARADR